MPEGKGTRLSLVQRLKRTKIYRPGMYKGLPKRLNWEQIENRTRRETHGALKGTGRRIVVVKSPDPKIFEQAIFIIREDYLMRKNSGKGDILREAQDVADRYIRTALLPPERGKLLRRVPAAAYAAGGAVLAGAAWLVLHLLQVI